MYFRLEPELAEFCYLFRNFCFARTKGLSASSLQLPVSRFFSQFYRVGSNPHFCEWNKVELGFARCFSVRKLRRWSITEFPFKERVLNSLILYLLFLAEYSLEESDLISSATIDWLVFVKTWFIFEIFTIKIYIIYWHQNSLF